MITHNQVWSYFSNAFFNTTLNPQRTSKQVKKQSLSARVVDAQMPDNHFTEEELMTFDDSDNADSALDKADQVTIIMLSSCILKHTCQRCYV